MSDSYERLASQAKLDALKLVHSEFDLSPKFSGDESLSLEIGTQWLHQHHDPDHGNVLGVCEWFFRGTAEGDADPRVSVMARYLVQYGNVHEQPDAAIHFLRDVGRMAAYPYFRAHVAMLVGDAGVMLPPLPSINIGTFRNQSVVNGRITPPKAGTATGGSDDDADD